jgi:5-methylcytosine-specific restriction endonuclease McrA
LQNRNKDKSAHLEYRRKYYANNSAKDIARVRRRQGRIHHGNLLMNLGEQVEVQGLYQFCQIFKGFEVDHIIPLNGKQVSGLHTLINLQVLPISINRSKGNKMLLNQGEING